ncbi:MAG: hypothetical protein IK147_04560 [Clostridia bacterium]|nr:hypothetical protein [Clostridia bacterium]
MKKTLSKIFLFLIAVICAFGFSACGGDKGETKTGYTVTVVGGTGGGEYEENADVTVTATVPDGKTFVKWVSGGEDVSTDNPYTFKVEKDVTLTAVFISDSEPVEYTVTRINIIGGNESPVGEETYAAGEQVRFVAEEIDYKIFVEWQVDGEKVSEETVYVLTVEKDVTLAAIYRGKPVNPIEDGGGF